MRLVTAVAAMLVLSGCSMNTGMDSTGRIGEYKTIDDYLKTIEKGVTTEANVITALGTPQSTMSMPGGVEYLTFGEETPFWKTGGVGQLLMGREQVEQLQVIIKNGIVSDYIINKDWVNR